MRVLTMVLTLGFWLVGLGCILLLSPMIVALFCLFGVPFIAIFMVILPIIIVKSLIWAFF